MPSGKPLRLVDPDTGEVTENACPHCLDWERTYAELELKYRGALSQIGNIKATDLEKAESHELWGWAIAVFCEWKVATGHSRAIWTLDRFNLGRWALESYSFADCRYAVWGLAATCFEKQVTPSYTRRYDEFWRVFGPSAGVQSADHFEAHVNEGKAIFGGDLPACEWDRILQIHRRQV